MTKDKRIIEGTINIDGLDVSYQKIENCKSPKFTLLYIHGLAGGKHTLNNLALKMNKYNFYSIDYPAHQKTKWNVLSELTMPVYGTLTKKFIKHIKLKNIIALGHSLGGGTLSELHSVAEIDGYILMSVISSALLEFLSNPAIESIKTVLKKLKSIYKEAGLKIPVKDFTKYIKSDPKLKSLSPQQFIVPLYSAMDYFNRADSNYKKIIKPCLVIHGDRDRIVPCNKTIRTLKGVLSNATYKIIKDCGHVPYETHEEETRKAIETFLDLLAS